MKMYSSINDRLKSQHLVVGELIRTLDNDLINNKPSRGKWSIKDNIAHITLYHLKFLNRMKLIKNEKESYFNRYIPDEDPEFNKLRTLSVQELLNSLNENRKLLVEYVNNLDVSELEKTATHQKFGKMNVVEWIEFFLLHEAHHIYTIFKLSRIK
jgi:uncharacterized damage-inducible protein DinB